MKPVTPQQFFSHLTSIAICLVGLMLFVLPWLPELIQLAFLINLSLGMFKIRQQFALRKVDLTARCQTVSQAAKLYVLSTIWWISEPLVKLQDQPKED